MKKQVRVEAILTERKRVGRPKKILDLRKLDKIKVAVPESAEHAIESLLFFDARHLDASTARELLRIFPRLIEMRHAWMVEFLEYGCQNCHKKRVLYASGGLCNTCCRRIGHRMRVRRRNVYAGRDIPAEIAMFTEALTLKFSTAQRLLNGDD
jgi:hypothetical protein